MASKKQVSSGGFIVPDWGIIKQDLKPFTRAGVTVNYERLFREATYYVHYEIAVKTLASEFIKYCAKHFDKKEAMVLKNLKDYHFAAIGKYTYLANKGAELTDEYVDAIEREYKKFLIDANKIVAEESAAEDAQQDLPKAPVVSIQQRMREQVAELLGEFEGTLDDILTGDTDIKSFNPYKQMQSYQPAIKPAHAKIIKDTYENEHAEAQLVVEWKDEDIKEGFAHLSTAKIRKTYLQFFEIINTACDTVINEGKATRKTRVRKAPSKEKLVAKLKYKDSESTLGLASINPFSIIGAKTLWVYNTKNRKLGCYVADEYHGPLSVKGTSITGFSESASTQKTVRKPEEVLKGAGKLARTKFDKLYTEIKTTETKMNGRINEHTVLIKVF